MNTQNTKEINNDNIYIQSLEAADIYDYIHRDREIKRKYVGMLPNSLNLDKLKKNGLKTFKSTRTTNIRSNDLINVKFNYKVKNSQELIDKENKSLKDCESKLLELNKRLENPQLDNDLDIGKLKELIQGQAARKARINENIEKAKEMKYESKTVEVLRQELYENGFTIKYMDRKEDKETGEVTKTLREEITYVCYKRTASKSRQSEVIFINKKLHGYMINWARMGMKLDDRTDIDYASLLGYESLVDSSIEGRIKIDVDGILLVSDVKSIFNIDVNLIKKDKETQLLESINMPDYKMESDIFDGEGLLDSSMFEGDYENVGMLLLRQHHFKCCVFNTNIQKFLQDWAADHGIDFDTWEISDIYNNKILAKSVRMITTPNSLKCGKLAFIKKSKNLMYEHWKKKVEDEDCVFGICKTDKASSLGFDENGNILNQTSYQMLNSIPFTKDEMVKLSAFEVGYIEALKDDDDVFIDFLERNANDRNSNQMWVDVYRKNPAIVGEKLFRNKRKKDINKYVDHCKKGKIRLSGDYCTIMQNGKELLYHAVRALPVDKGILNYDKWADEMILSGNEIYTTLHPFDKEYTCFRNPHTSPSNVLVAYNKTNEFIEKYFNLTKQIVYANAINFELNRLLNGSDVDSDQMVIFDNETMLAGAKRCYRHYRVCENGVENSKNKYNVTNTDMAKIDNAISKSQTFIGEVTNLGQLYMSKYWDAIAKGDEDKDKIDKLLRGVDIACVLGELAIDYAKRIPDVDINKQINNLTKDLPSVFDVDENEIKDNSLPNFFKYIKKGELDAKDLKHHDTACDFLFEILDGIKRAEGNTNVYIRDLLINNSTKDVKKAQLVGIIDINEEMNSEVAGVRAKYSNRYENEEKKEVAAEQHMQELKVVAKYMQKLKRYRITETNMYALINRVFAKKNNPMKINCKYKADLLNILYNENKDVFLSVFKSVEEDKTVV